MDLTLINPGRLITDPGDLRDALDELFRQCSLIATEDAVAGAFVRAYVDADPTFILSDRRLFSSLRTLAGRAIFAPFSVAVYRSWEWRRTLTWRDQMYLF